MPKQKPNEQVQQIPLSEIRPFKNHPFKVTDDELMQQTIDSIMQVGVLNPAIIRPAPEGGYEMVAGHRRLHAADLAGLKTIPAIVRNLDDDEAVILMVDSNLQRETISPMERAQAYKMKLEALKHQGKRVDLTCDQVGHKLDSKKSIQKVAEDAGESKTQVQRYIRLTELLPEVQKKVDSKEIAFSPAVELSYLTHDEQKQFLDAMDYSQNTPSLSQAQRLKKLSREGKCTKEAMRSIMSEEKKEEQERITLSSDTLRKYFPRSYTPLQMKTLYEDKLSGKTSEDNYCVLSQEYSDEREQLQKKILKLRRKLTEMGEKENEREEFIHAIRKFMEMRTLTKQVLNELIDNIDVYETQGTGKNKTQRLVIYYKFVGYLDIDPTQCHPNYTADIREGVAIEYVSCEPSDSLKELFSEGYNADDDSFEEVKTEQA